jgi:hypothetical protein
MVVDTCLDSELGTLVHTDIPVEHMFEAVHILVVVLVEIQVRRIKTSIFG